MRYVLRQNQFHANVEARVKLLELIEGSALRRIAVAFLHHLILDNAKLLHYWAGRRIDFHHISPTASLHSPN